MSIMLNALIAKAEESGMLDVARQILDKGAVVGYVERAHAGRVYAALWIAAPNDIILDKMTAALAEIDLSIENDRKVALELLEAEKKKAVAKAKELAAKAGA